MKRIKISLALAAGLLVGSAQSPASAGPQPMPQPMPQPQPQPSFDVYQFCAMLGTYPGDCVHDITYGTVPNNIPLYGTPPPDSVSSSDEVSADTGG